MININLFRAIFRERARQLSQDLGGIITCEDIIDDMVRTAQNPNKKVRYPGDLDALRTEKRCYQCPECSGSGLVGVEDREGLEYLGCEYCSGMQCFDAKTDDYFQGECDESCGFNRERLHEDWPKM